MHYAKICKKNVLNVQVGLHAAGRQNAVMCKNT